MMIERSTNRRVIEEEREKQSQSMVETIWLNVAALRACQSLLQASLGGLGDLHR